MTKRVRVLSDLYLYYSYYYGIIQVRQTDHRVTASPSSS